MLHPKASIKQKRGDVTLRDKAPHAQGGSDIRAVIPSIASMAKNMMNRSVELALQLQQELVTLGG